MKFTPTLEEIKIAVTQKRLILPSFIIALSISVLTDSSSNIQDVLIWLILGTISFLIALYNLVKLLIISNFKHKAIAYILLIIIFTSVLFAAHSNVVIIARNYLILVLILAIFSSTITRWYLKARGWQFGLLGAKQVSMFTGLKKKHKKQCVKCKSIMKDNDKFCEKCGEQYADFLACKHCKMKIKQKSKFCPSCGKVVN